ncbi:DUF493 domain-containing protein [bacterium]|nr:DUF493 domain-containing protein [bacterium]
MVEQEPPKIEFPCDYPIKILGRQAEDFRALVIEVVSAHTAPIDESLITERPSGKGTFVAVTMTITATGAEQLETIHRALKATGRVHMVI